jgi:hypothetical protein
VVRRDQRGHADRLADLGYLTLALAAAPDLGRFIGNDTYPRPGQLDCPVVMEVTDNVLSTCQPTNVLSHVTLRHVVLAADASTSRNRRWRGVARRYKYSGRQRCWNQCRRIADRDRCGIVGADAMSLHGAVRASTNVYALGPVTLLVREDVSSGPVGPSLLDSDAIQQISAFESQQKCPAKRSRAPTRTGISNKLRAALPQHDSSGSDPRNVWFSDTTKTQENP